VRVAGRRKSHEVVVLGSWSTMACTTPMPTTAFIGMPEI
jgi:hypothetical protein